MKYYIGDRFTAFKQYDIFLYAIPKSNWIDSDYRYYEIWNHNYINKFEGW